MSNKLQHTISLPTAIELTTRFRANKTRNLPICETFDLASVQTLLSVPNSAFLRIYLGEKENGDVCLVLVAADANGNDILPLTTDTHSTTDEETPLILEDAIRCPELCPPPSPLNE